MDGFPVETPAADHVGEVLEDVGARDDVYGGRLGEGFPRVVGLDSGEVIVARAEDGGGALEDARALDVRGGGPGWEGFLCGGDGGVDGGGGGGVDVGEGLCGCGVDGLEGGGGGRGGLELAVVVGEAWGVGERHGGAYGMGWMVYGLRGAAGIVRDGRALLGFD